MEMRKRIVETGCVLDCQHRRGHPHERYQQIGIDGTSQLTVRIARHREGSGNSVAETAGCLGGFLLATTVLFQTPSPMLDEHRFLGLAVFEQSLLAPTPRFLLSETDLLGHSLRIRLEET